MNKTQRKNIVAHLRNTAKEIRAQEKCLRLKKLLLSHARKLLRSSTSKVDGEDLEQLVLNWETNILNEDGRVLWLGHAASHKQKSPTLQTIPPQHQAIAQLLTSIGLKVSIVFHTVFDSSLGNFYLRVKV